MTEKYKLSGKTTNTSINTNPNRPVAPPETELPTAEQTGIDKLSLACVDLPQSHDQTDSHRLNVIPSLGSTGNGWGLLSQHLSILLLLFWAESRSPTSLT